MARDKDRIRANKHRYYLENKERIQEYAKGWRARTKEHRAEKGKLWREANVDRRREYNKAWKIANSDRVASYEEAHRDEKRLKVYGLTIADYESMLDQQGGGCALCLSTKMLGVDHDHSTGAVRGILCQNCNTGLGKLGDSMGSLKRAMAYLARSAAEERGLLAKPEVTEGEYRELNLDTTINTDG